MKLRFKQHGISIEIKIPIDIDNISNELFISLKNSAKSIIDYIIDKDSDDSIECKSNESNSGIICGINNSTIFTNNTPQYSEPEKQRPFIRERLPNNIVDMDNLDISNAKVKKSFLRCPSCGQAHCLAVKNNNSIYFMVKDIENDEYKIITVIDEDSEHDFNSENILSMCMKDNMSNYRDYFDDLQDIAKKHGSDDDFVVDNDTIVFCPICKEKNTFSKWSDAYINPSFYFEYDKVCDICGGECIKTISKGKEIDKCEECNTKYIDNKIV